MSEDRSFVLNIESSPAQMGRAAAEEAAKLLERETRELGREVVAVFAAAPSQDTFLDALVERKERIAWDRVVAFHLDEYVSLPKEHPNTFKAYLQEHIFSRVPIPSENLHFIKDAPESVDVADWYGEKFATALGRVRANNGIYVGFLGIGVNGHIAFNEPNSSLDQAAPFLHIELDQTSIQQQYDDYKNHPNPAARYASIDSVPRKALTMSVSAILEADSLLCMVPGAQKREALRLVVEGVISGEVPASLLRLHQNSMIYTDRDSSSLLRSKPASILVRGVS